MSVFLEQVADGIDVAPLLAQLDAHSELWNVHQERKVGPHVAMSDIWVRYFAREVLTGPEAFRGRHPFVFYPAWDALTELRPIIDELVEIEQAAAVGGILITRIPPGGVIGWHHDRGSWHAEFFDRKLYVPLRANDQCVNYVGRERAVMTPGSAWYFDNLVDHAVVNRGTTERITLIICLRRFASLSEFSTSLLEAAE
jgi:aspartyl/asparaginyl beta-hydroxylase